MVGGRCCRHVVAVSGRIVMGGVDCLGRSWASQRWYAGAFGLVGGSAI